MLTATASTYTLSFREADFTYSTNAAGELVIGTLSTDMTYPEGMVPGLPLMIVDIALPQGQALTDHRVHTTARTVRSGVRVAVAPVPMPTDGSTEGNNAADNSSARAPYRDGVWPAEVCEYTGTSSWDGVDVAHFLVSPYRYDSATGTLSFNEVIELTLDTESGSGRMRAPGAVAVTGRVPDIVRSIVINPYELPEESRMDSGRMNAAAATAAEAPLDYAIITSKVLQNAFAPWAAWKTRKGIRTEVITVEEIYSRYGSSDKPLAIKKYLYDLYRDRGLRFVMLGGDDTVVPVKPCHCIAGTGRVDKQMPADVYYVTYGGNFEWDANGNKVYGEPEDGVDFSPWLSCTRMPVRTAAHVSDAFDKIYRYELGQSYSHSFLGCGKLTGQMSKKNPAISDAQEFVQLLYDVSVKPHWNGRYDKLFDFDSSFGDSYRFRPDNINTIFGRGYSFIKIDTHGNQTLYSAVDRQYRPADIAKLNNSGLSIIVTNACITNAFDSTDEIGNADPCQSEAFIRTKATGVVAYLGCSRSGYYYNNGGTSLGPSCQFEERVFNHLFRKDGGEKNWGAMVAAGKAEMISSCKTNGSFRWIQMGLNPIGDAEMPVFIDYPKQLKVTLRDFDGNKVLDTGVGDCRVCIMSAADGGKSLYSVIENVRTLDLNSYGDLSRLNITVTKAGYCPVCLDNGEFGPITGDRARWMSTLPDDAYLCRLSIPGTHDAGTGNGWAGFLGKLLGPSTGTTQDLKIADQLTGGVRCFDLRPSLEDGNLIIFHGPLETNIWFAAALSNIRDFLIANPTETVIVVIRHETDNDDGSANWAPKMASTLQSYSNYIAQFRPDITLGEARGKMLVMCRDAVDFPKAAMVSSWGDNATYRTATGRVNGKSFTIHLQDKYDCTGSGALEQKRTAISDLLGRASDLNRNRSTIGQWVINHASGYTKTASSSNNKDTSNKTAETIIKYVADHQAGAMGIVMMDYAGTCKYDNKSLVDVIINNNVHYNIMTNEIATPLVFQTPASGDSTTPQLNVYLPYNDELTPRAKVHAAVYRDGKMVWNVTDTKGSLSGDAVGAEGYDIVAAYAEIPGYGESELVIYPAAGREKLPTPKVEYDGRPVESGAILPKGSKITITHRPTKYDIP